MRATESIGQFEKLFVKTTTCWNWIGQKHPLGYGIVSHPDGRREVAHRIAYRFYVGDFNPSLHVCHSCDNPRCVNPDHLFVGTQKDNMHDMIAKGRKSHKAAPGDRNGRSIFSLEQVLEMRRLFAGGSCVRDIHRQFGGAYQSVWLIIKNQTWRTDRDYKPLTH